MNILCNRPQTKILAVNNKFKLAQRKTDSGNSLCLLGSWGQPIKSAKIPVDMFEHIGIGRDSIVYSFESKSGAKVVKVYYKVQCLEKERGIEYHKSLEKLEYYKIILEKMAEVAEQELLADQYLFDDNTRGRVKVKIVTIDSICSGIDEELSLALKNISNQNYLYPRGITQMQYNRMPVGIQEYIYGPCIGQLGFEPSDLIIKKLNSFVSLQLIQLDSKKLFEPSPYLDFGNVKVIQKENELTFVVTDPLAIIF